MKMKRHTWIQERDIEILRHIVNARILTVQEIEWLCFQEWRARYRAAVELAQQTQQYITYEIARRARLRVKGMVDHGLLTRITRTTERGVRQFKRLPDGYTITSEGAVLLATTDGIESKTIWTADQRGQALQNMEHAIGIGTFYAALVTETTYRGVPITNWVADHLLARDYDRIPILGGIDPYPVLPDATWVLNGHRYFLEYDRGTRPGATWLKKARAYEGYRSTTKLNDRYATNQFTVLVVAPNSTRVKNIAEAVTKVTRTPPANYQFLIDALVHPTTIRRGWTTIQAVQFTTRIIVHRPVEMPNIVFAPATLWENPSATSS